jgi:hypothetical protein
LLLRVNAGAYPVAAFVIDGDEFRYTAIFDPARISKSRLHELLLFSPYPDFGGYGAQIDHHEVTISYEKRQEKVKKELIPDPLELCVNVDPRYRPCGARDISAPNFFTNAQTNVARNDQILSAFNKLDVPTELSIILQQFRESMTFYSTIERRRLEYLRTSDLGALSRPVANIDPSKACSKELGELKEAATFQRRYELARSEWHNCLNSEWRRVSPAYPKEAWATFLRDYGISERYTNKPVD